MSTVWSARANERTVQWGDDPRPWWRRIDWRLAAFIVGYVTVLALAAHVGWMWAAR